MSTPDEQARAEMFIRYESGADWATVLRGYLELHNDPKAAVEQLLWVDHNGPIYSKRRPDKFRDWLKAKVAEVEAALRQSDPHE